MDSLISIIMSVKNCEDFIEESITSILNQSYTDFEFLILDDASSDKTFEICENYSSIDSRIKLYKNNETFGLTKSLNILIQKSKGKIIARQDGDDFSVLNRLELQLQKYNESMYKIITSRTYLINEKRIKPFLAHYMPNNIIIRYKNPFVHGSLMIEKDLLLKIGGYDEEFYYAQDYKLFSDLLKNKQKVFTFSKPLYYTRNTLNISTLKLEEQEFYASKVRQSYK